jgi:hypothetical protein
MLTTRIIHNQGRASSILCLLLCDSGPGDITFERSSLRLTELSQPTSGCGNSSAKADLVRGWYITRYSKSGISCYDGIVFQTSCEHVLVALTVSTFCACHVLSSDRRDRLASPSENKNEELPLPSSSLPCNTSAIALCCLSTNISLSPYAFFQGTNPRNVLFCNVANR